MHLNQTEQWHDFFAAFATSAAALVGLFFVVSSLHLDRLGKDTLFQHRAHNIAVVMMLLFLQALTPLAPQTQTALGAEIVILNLIVMYFPSSAVWIMHKKGLPLPLLPLSTTISCTACAGFGGGLLFFNRPWGLYLLAAADAVSMFVLVVNAWSLMLGAWRTEALKRT